MPKFKIGAPQVKFRKRNGKTFTKTYHTRNAAARSIQAWKKRGGKVLGTSSYTPTKSGKSLWGTKSGLTQRSGRYSREKTY